MTDSERIWRPRILFAGGGTGGHVYPAIAVADALRRKAPASVVAFAGTQERLEWEAVPKAGYPIQPITVSGLKRSLSVQNLAVGLKLLKGLKQSWDLITDFDPHVVVGTGGYVSLPVLWVAGLRGRPTLIQEQNAYAGITNKWLAKRASRIHIAFEEAKAYFPADKCFLSGNPTRQALMNADAGEARRFFDIPDATRVLFVFGGSLGSAAINAALEAHFGYLLEDPDLYLIWQTGKRYYDRLSNLQHERLRMLKYVERMDLAYAAADLVVCRAGAITCSELMITGSPALLIPSPNVAEDHQTFNAKAMEAKGAARMLPETELDRLTQEVKDLLNDPDRLRAMAQAALQMARPDAADRIADDVLALAELHRR